jgi:hypothetical protein
VRHSILRREPIVSDIVEHAEQAIRGLSLACREFSRSPHDRRRHSPNRSQDPSAIIKLTCLAASLTLRIS